MTTGEPVIRLDEVSKVYHLPSGDVRALDRVSLEVEAGGFLAIMGPSGSGKSTLLNLIGCLDTPTTGEVYIRGVPTSSMNDDGLTDLRRDHIGFVFQQFNLIPLLTILENVEYPLQLKERSSRRPERAAALLERMGLGPDMHQHRPSEISGGEQQRVAIARALVNDPDIILCDEPTGDLDSRTGAKIMEILSEVNSQGRTVIMVTHDPEVAGYAERTITIVDGRIA
ncbi:MAG: ABC transporter ATP-binding protein [Methanoculleaceae archaeon]